MKPLHTLKYHYKYIFSFVSVLARKKMCAVSQNFISQSTNIPTFLTYIMCLYALFQIIA